MRNIQLDDGTENDIKKRIERLHKDLGSPEGAVNLIEVRELLRLDLQYYSAKDVGVLDGVVHKLTVGVKQVLLRPTLLVDVVKKFELRALFLPDRKRILIDKDLPDLKKRWTESHEISHSVLPWHADFMLGDDRTTLSPSCHERIEAEANYGAGKLLFPAKYFSEIASSEPITFALIRKLAKHFGNTITSTLWRFIENSDGLIFGVIGEHPHYPCEHNPNIEYFIRSRGFERQFADVSENEIGELIKSYSGRNKTGPLGRAEVIIADVNSKQHVFIMETFSTKYHALTIAHYYGKREIIIQMAK